ncbi:DinB family protein [Candidatus Acetothermia bacterium]|nr:DinB family protein [Candidatus Acetothermia bacterium]MBI3642589.1 DinB family protein [Candidatus Acetothermia bacterium]
MKQDLETAYRGSHWHSFQSALRGLSPDEARWKPPHYQGFPWMDGSIQKIIFHVGGDNLYQLDHALGERKLSWDELQVNYKPAMSDLKSALQLADRGYQALQDALGSLTDESLAKKYPTPEGKGKRSLEGLFKMMIEHYFYHAGQIVYIRSLWKGLRKSE